MAKQTIRKTKSRRRKVGPTTERCHICHGTGIVKKQSRKK